MRDFNRLLAFVRPYWKQMTAALVCMFVAVALGLLLPWVVQNLVDVVFVQKDIHMLTCDDRAGGGFPGAERL